jgi:N-methylhydantoinase A
MRLDADGAASAFGRLGETLGLDPVEAAWGIREIALAEMVKAVRARLSVYALTAADHSLVSYGGCGALFAAEVAQKAGLKRVLIPELASVLSAFGAATMDIRRERLASLVMWLPGDPTRIDQAFAEVQAGALRDLDADGVPEQDRVVKFEADVRFAGQRWELPLALPDEPALGDGGRQIEEIFREEYLRRYGAAATTTSGVVELVALRGIGIGRMAGGGAAPEPVTASAQRPARPVGTRLVSLDRGQPPVPVNMFDESVLTAGEFLVGPALIDGSDTTFWIPRGLGATMDGHRTLVIEVSR